MNKPRMLKWSFVNSEQALRTVAELLEAKRQFCCSFTPEFIEIASSAPVASPEGEEA